jgi:AAA domain
MRLEVLIGMIASGKSTYARHRADEGALVICHDDLTEMLHKRYRYEADLRKVYADMMTCLVRFSLRAGKDVVVDRTNLTKSARYTWIGVAWEWNLNAGTKAVEIEAVVFPQDRPEVHSTRRFESDGRGRHLNEWLNVALHHAEQLRDEPVTLAEGFDSIVNVCVADIQKWAAEPCPFPAYLPPRS